MTRAMNGQFGNRKPATRMCAYAACLGVILCTAAAARANIDLELRPVNDRVVPSQTIEIGLYAVSDNGSSNQTMAAAVVLLSWDPAYLKLLGHNTTGAEPMSSGSGFPLNDRSHLNEASPPQDGNGMFQGLALLGQPVAATPAGTLLMTLEFQALRTTTLSNVDILALSGNPVTGSIVYDGRIPNTNVTGALRGTQVSIMDCVATTDCNSNGISDFCDIIDGTSRDCNNNGIPDTCDIVSGVSGDCDGNQVPDACDPALALNNCPDIVVQANTSFGIAVNFPTPIAENGCNAVVTTSPASGSLFTIGTTVVTVTATDATNRVETCSFNITVEPAGASLPPNQTPPPTPIPMPSGSSGGVCGMGSAAMMPFMLIGLGWVRRRSRRRPL